MARTEKADAQYKQFDEPFGVDPRGPFRKVDSTANAKGGRFVESLTYPVTNPFTGEKVYPRAGRCWVYRREVMEEMIADRRYFWGRDGRAGTPIRKLFRSEAERGMTAPSIWDDVGLNQHAAREIELLFGSKASFETPKPEGLLHRVLEIATNPGDLVLDSFAGSGTTGAVAHKMGRRWIMVEIGDHADTHIVPRLTKVIDGEDQGGVTKAVGWQGGGGFRYYTLASSLLERDAYDNWVIAPEYNGPMLAQAMCKHLGFNYDPAQDGDTNQGGSEWWRHGRSSERDFLYVTTQALTQDVLRLLSEEVGPNRSLLICARAFSGNIDGFENLTCRKIPASILTKCEWGRDDYSLQIAALPARVAVSDTPDAGSLFVGAPSND